MKDSTTYEISTIQSIITVLDDFLINCVRTGKLNDTSKDDIFNLFCGNKVTSSQGVGYEEKLSIYRTKHILNLKEDEERLLKNYNKEEMV